MGFSLCPLSLVPEELGNQVLALSYYLVVGAVDLNLRIVLPPSLVAGARGRDLGLFHTSPFRAKSELLSYYGE